MGKQTITAIATFLVLVCAYVFYDHSFGRLTDFKSIDKSLLDPLDDSEDELTPLRKPESEIAAERGLGKERAAKTFEQAVFQLPEDVTVENPVGRGLGLFMFFETKVLQYNNDPHLVEFAPFTMVYITAKPGMPATSDNIHTIQAERAVVRFNQPFDFGRLTAGIKPISGWVEGQVVLKTNQGTSVTGDDIRVETERLDFNDVRKKIETNQSVTLIGEDGMRVAAVGMEIELDDSPQEKGAEIMRGSGVRRIQLFERVRFHLLITGENHMLSDVNSNPKQQQAKEKVPLDVAAAGPFDYDMRTKIATFNKNVEVERVVRTPKPMIDKLLSDRLVLKFKQRDTPEAVAPAAAPAATKNQPKKQSENLALESAEAMGETVVVLAESQKIHATCNYLHHDANTGVTKLTGAQDMVVVQDNIRIVGRSINIERSKPGEKGGFHSMVVQGPKGLLEVFDRGIKGQKPLREMVIRFDKQLRVVPEERGGKLATIVGNVELEMPKQPLAMTCEELVVRSKEMTFGGERKSEPVWLQARNTIAVKSPEVDVSAGQSLTINIEYPDADKPGVIPHAGATVAAAAPVAASQSKPAPQPQTKQRDEPKGLITFDINGDKEPGGKASDHVEVRAETVELFVDRRGRKTQARRAEALGDVYIHRTTADRNPDEALEILGDRVELVRNETGDRMKVWGGRKRANRQPPRFAEIRNRKMHLYECLLIDMDEATNIAKVENAGKMVVQNSGLIRIEDDQRSQTPSRGKPFIVAWTDEMTFDGQNAEFVGDVIGQQYEDREADPPEQITQELRCDRMYVVFKSRLEFKRTKGAGEGSRKLEMAKIICDKKVLLREHVLRATNTDAEATEADLIRYSRMQADSLRVNNDTRIVEANGSQAIATFIELNKPDADKPQEEQLPFARTDIRFNGKMIYNNVKRSAVFTKDCVVIRSPIATARELVSEEKLRPDAIVVRADEIRLNERMNGKRKHFDFQAESRVHLTSQQYEGFGDRATYEQERDRMLLEGNPAVLKQENQSGQGGQTFSAGELEYFIKANHVKVRNAGRTPAFDINQVIRGTPVKGKR